MRAIGHMVKEAKKQGRHAPFRLVRAERFHHVGRVYSNGARLYSPRAIKQPVSSLVWLN